MRSVSARLSVSVKQPPCGRGPPAIPCDSRDFRAVRDFWVLPPSIWVKFVNFFGVALALLLLAAPAPAPARDSLGAFARDYVRLVLEIGERDPGYVDAYYGPAEWREAAHANPRTTADLAAAVETMKRRLEAIPAARGSLEGRRRDFPARPIDRGERPPPSGPGR